MEKQNEKSLIVQANVKVVLCEMKETSNPSIEQRIDGESLVVSALVANNDTVSSEVQEIYLPIGDYSRIVANENATIVLSKDLRYTPELTIEAHAGSVKAETISCYKLNIETSSGGQVHIAGDAYVARIHSTSGSKVMGKNLVCSALSAGANSGAEIEATVDKKIMVEEAFNGSVTCYYLTEIEKNVKSDCNRFYLKKIMI